MSHNITGNQLVRVIATLQLTLKQIEVQISMLSNKYNNVQYLSTHSETQVEIVQLQRKKKEIQEQINQLTLILNT